MRKAVLPLVLTALLCPAYAAPGDKFALAAPVKVTTRFGVVTLPAGTIVAQQEDLSFKDAAGNKVPVTESAGQVRLVSGARKAVVAAPSSTPAPRSKEIPLEEKQAYKEGWDDGFLVGKTDAVEGRSRDGEKAMRLGKIHSTGRPDPDAYAKGYHYGYNEGWHRRKALENK